MHAQAAEVLRACAAMALSSLRRPPTVFQVRESLKLDPEVGPLHGMPSIGLLCLLPPLFSMDPTPWNHEELRCLWQQRTPLMKHRSRREAIGNPYIN